jgi:hypothetical protein
MSLFDFIDEKSAIGDKYDKYLALKQKLLKEGLPEHLAEYKASNLLTPDKLEKVNIAVKNSEGRRIGVTFFFDNKEELELLAKYMPYNPHVGQCKNATLLIELLKLMEEVK